MNSPTHYDPPAAIVEELVRADARARGKWLLVPVGYAALTFISLFVWWWLQQPADAGSLNFSVSPDVLFWLGKESLYQGVVVLVVTAVLLAALPRIDWRHAIYASLLSVATSYLVQYVAERMNRPIETNGDQLWSIVATNGAVLLVFGAIIRRSRNRDVDGRSN